MRQIFTKRQHNTLWWIVFVLLVSMAISEAAFSLNNQRSTLNSRISTVALTDHNATITGMADYTPYGNLQSPTGELANANVTPFLFVGAYGVMTDAATGLHQMRARWYSSHLRRFLSEDPAGFAGGENFYAYAADNPISLIDPDGRDPMAVWGFGNMQAPGATAVGVYKQTGNPALALQTATGLGNASFRDQTNQVMIGASLGIAAPAVAVAAVEAAPVVGAGLILTGHRAANVVLANPPAAVTAIQTTLAAVGLSTRNPPAPWNPYPAIGGLFNRFVTQPTVNTVRNSLAGQSQLFSGSVTSRSSNSAIISGPSLQWRSGSNK